MLTFCTAQTNVIRTIFMLSPNSLSVRHATNKQVTSSASVYFNICLTVAFMKSFRDVKSNSGNLS